MGFLSLVFCFSNVCYFGLHVCITDVFILYAVIGFIYSMIEMDLC